MRENLTQTIEDYLKTIYEITATNERASTNQIAKALNVTPASVTGMMKKLATIQPPLLEYLRHRGVVLTSEGRQVALEIIRHHRLIELFLHQMLGYEWDKVHAEADRLEHVISEEFEERIAQALGNPSHDPHGDPIPNRNLSLPDSPHNQLSDLRPGQIAVIHRVNDSSSELLRHLSDLGLIPGTRVYVQDYSPFDQNISLRIKGQEKQTVLGPNITRQINVEIIANNSS